MTLTWPTIERFVTEHGAAALGTLAKLPGASPREAWARMVVRPGWRFPGTIAGRVLERPALAEAEQMMANSNDRANTAFRGLDKSFGAGHVGVSLVMALAPFVGATHA